MSKISWSILGLILVHLLGFTYSKDLKFFRKCILIVGGSCPDNKYIDFYLYTRQNKQKSDPIQVVDTKDNFDETHFNTSHPNKVIIPGFNPYKYAQSVDDIIDAYLEAGDFNVWVVDWARLGKGGVCSPLSTGNTGHVGRCTGELLSAIHRHASADEVEASIHVIAMGAGTTVANYLSRAFEAASINRITGLNPAKSFTENDAQTLDASDADFVDVIHSSSFLQHRSNIGHVDFYVNPSNSLHQPGCSGIKNKFDCDFRCALQYFAESITSEIEFLAWKCDGYPQFLLGMCGPEEELEVMGEHCSDWSRGLYICYTSAESPFALGHWNEPVFKDKGPSLRTDRVAVISTRVKKKINTIKDYTPEIVKDLGIIDSIKSRLEERTELIASKTTDTAKSVAKGIYKHTFRRKKNKDEGDANNKPPEDPEQI